MPGTGQAQEVVYVNVNLLNTLATLQEAGSCYREQLRCLGGPVDVQAIAFRDPDQMGVFRGASDMAMDSYLAGKLPGSEVFDRDLVETAYDLLKRGKISLLMLPGR